MSQKLVFDTDTKIIGFAFRLLRDTKLGLNQN